MKKCIIFPDPDGVAILYPSENCGLTLEQIAEKDIPQGRPYKIINISDLPEDYQFRGAWEYQE